MVQPQQAYARDAAPPDGVLALLRALRARVQPQVTQTSLRALLPAYERLLRPDAPVGDREALVMRELQRVRSIFKSESDLFDVAQMFDERVEKCLELGDAPRGANVWSMSDALRMLLALAGGDDGATFVLEDPTRVQFGVPSVHAASGSAASTRRLGERIHMNNIGIITQTQHTLLRSATLPLETEAVLGQYDFASLIPKSAREATLWYPERSGESETLGKRDLSNLPPSTMLDSLQQLQSANSGVPRIIDIPPLTQHDASPGSPSSLVKKDNLVASQRVNPSPSRIDTEVFFFDASTVVKSRPSDVSDHDGSVTEASTKCDDDAQSAAMWTALVNGTPQNVSWEALGTECSPSCCSLSLLHTKESDPLRQPLPLSMSASNSGASIVEVDEVDIIENVGKALCGIESVMFRRDVTTASLRLPRKIIMKMHTATPSSLLSILEEFRSSGTAFLRLEYLSVYYAQDPSRGGKTCQSLADALKLYLSAYQRVIMDHVKAIEGPSCSVSLIATLSRTRVVRRQLVALSCALRCSCDVDTDFWRLLSGGAFPRGIDLLNLVQRELQECECEDATGSMTLLWRWLLVRSSQPFVSLISSYVASGQTPLDLDPHNEFRLSVFSTLQDLEDAPDSSDSNAEDLVPHFLEGSCSRIISIGRLQQMLCSILPQTDLLPLDGLRLPLRISEAQSRLDHTRSLVMELAKRVAAACNSDKPSLISRRPLRSPTKSPRSDDSGVDEWIAVKRKRLDHKHATQKAQREMLDLSIRERAEEVSAQAAVERLADAEAEISRSRVEYAQFECGKELLIAKYAPLIADADDRHTYMKWRRDRAVRLSASKAELTELFEREGEEWQTARESSPLIDRATGIQTSTEDQPSGQRQDTDVVMHDAGAASHGAVLTTPRDPIATTVSPDIIDDSGLLWRPRIRVQNVPGGGGRDAMAMLYPDRHQSQITTSVPTFFAQRSSVIITQPGRSEGFAAYESIYGGGSTNAAQSRRRSDEDTNQTRSSSAGDANSPSITTGEDLHPTHPTDSVDMTNDEARLSAPIVNEDVEMATHDGEETAMDEPMTESECNPGSSGSTSVRAKPEVSKENLNPALATLHSVTSFLRADISPEDTGVLHAVLHSDTALSSTLPTPFRSLSELALADPITVIHDFVDRMALQAIVVKLDLKAHLLWLHRIALMSEGLCMATFTRDLFTQLRSDMRVLLALPGRLTSSLALAMIEARTVTSTGQLPPFTYRIENEFVSVVSSGPSTPSMVEVVQLITLNYGVSIHLAAVLTPRAIANYQRVHQFLLLMRLTEHEIKDTWLDWRKSSLRSETQSANMQRTCDLVLHSAQMLLNAFLETFTNHVLESKWAEFMHGIDGASSVSWLRVAHEKFACEAISCCFLQSDQIETLHVFHTLVECAWSLGKLIEAADKHGDSMDPFQSKLHDVARAQTTGMNTLATHLYRLESSPDRCLRDFTKHFLLRLNLNGFFADPTVASPHE